MQNLPQERLSIAMIAAAACEHILDLSLAYAKEREAFGRPIGKFQHNRFLIAEMATEAHIARVFVDDCVQRHNRGELDAKLASMAKWWTTELQNKLVDRAVQLHGGYGYMMEYPIAQGLRGQPDPDDLRRHHRDPEGDHRPLARDLAGRNARVRGYCGRDRRAPRIGLPVPPATRPAKRRPRMSDVLEQRAEIEQRIEGQTFCTALARTVAERGGAPAYSDKVGVSEGWRTLSWDEVREQTLDLAAGYVALGLAPHDTVAVMASNRTEHVLADFAGVHAGGIPMSVYATLAPEQVAYVAGHAQPSVVVLEGADQLARWRLALEECPSIAAVVVIDDAALPADDPRFVGWTDLLERGRAARAADPGRYDDLWRSVRPEDPLTILYTSGTTGNPKGVVLTHRNILFETESSLDVSGMREPGVTVSYLPFAHIAERMLGIYIPQYQGGHVHLVGDPALLVGALGEVHPTRFFGVPRVWEKVRTGVSALLSAETDEQKVAAVAKAMDVGLRYVESRQTGEQTSPELAEEFRAMDAAVLRPIRSLLGLDRVEWAASAAAPMPLEVARFFAGLGLSIYDVYGMTETSAVVTGNGPDQFRLGSVGRPCPASRSASATTARSWSGARCPRPATSRPRTPPGSSSTRTGGCTPATSASATRTASSTSWTGRRR